MYVIPVGDLVLFSWIRLFKEVQNPHVGGYGRTLGVLYSAYSRRRPGTSARLYLEAARLNFASHPPSLLATPQFTLRSLACETQLLRSFLHLAFSRVTAVYLPSSCGVGFSARDTFHSSGLASITPIQHQDICLTQPSDIDVVEGRTGHFQQPYCVSHAVETINTLGRGNGRTLQVASSNGWMR